MVDNHSGLASAWRGDERFPMCSTFKFLAAALVLSRFNQGQEQLSRRIAVQAFDIVPYSLVIQPRVGGVPMKVTNSAKPPSPSATTPPPTCCSKASVTHKA